MTEDLPVARFTVPPEPESLPDRAVPPELPVSPDLPEFEPSGVEGAGATVAGGTVVTLVSPLLPPFRPSPRLPALFPALLLGLAAEAGAAEAGAAAGGDGAAAGGAVAGTSCDSGPRAGSSTAFIGLTLSSDSGHTVEET
ncbi:MAG TPA: hypothetical protein VFL56_05755, partial [Solirubrobacterales bacterium]|nr:hypothetical protein [Solirubrobacterales bacterium]